jgi:hypothetical protein
MDQRFSQIEEMLKELLEWRKTTENNSLRASPRPPPTNIAIRPEIGSDHPSRFSGDLQSEADQGLRAPDPVDLSLDGMTVVADSLQHPGSTFLGERLPSACDHDLH